MLFKRAIVHYWNGEIYQKYILIEYNITVGKQKQSDNLIRNGNTLRNFSKNNYLNRVFPVILKVDIVGILLKNI